MFNKREVAELALFGGAPLFEQYRSTSNLVPPDADKFFSYSRRFYDAQAFIDNGPLVPMLEERLAAFHQSRFCVTFCSGFWALVLAMKCLALESRNEVVMPSLTYRRMADIAAWVRLVPHFCEVDPDTLAISARTAEACINENTALILGVHPIVNCCDVAGLTALAADRELPLLFDSVESVYESYQGRKIGSFGRAECFSMHASKLLNGFECGYLTTDDADLASRLRRLRAPSISGEDSELGIDAQLNEVHAAMALAALDDIDAQVERNRKRYYTYQRTLASVSGVSLLTFDENERCGFKNIVIRLREDWPLSREATLTILHAEKILARPYYSPPLHKKRMAYPSIAGDLTLTERLAEEFVLLPCGHFVNDEDIEDVAALLHFISRHAGDIADRLGK